MKKLSTHLGAADISDLQDVIADISRNILCTNKATFPYWETTIAALRVSENLISIRAS